VSQLYERELKGILMADRDVLVRVTKNLPAEEQIPYMKIMEKPFVVVRAAGSFGIDMAVVGSISFLVEEKSSSEPLYHFNAPRIVEQAELLLQLCSSAGIIPVYAYRLKNLRGRDPWRLFTMELNEGVLDGKDKLVHDRLPKLERTKSYNYVMRWENGMPLHRFIDYIVSIRKRVPEA
jgi:hypothetical protein